MSIFIPPGALLIQQRFSVVSEQPTAINAHTDGITLTTFNRQVCHSQCHKDVSHLLTL